MCRLRDGDVKCLSCIPMEMLLGEPYYETIFNINISIQGNLAMMVYRNESEEYFITIFYSRLKNSNKIFDNLHTI